jgi:hypothetical protein
MAHGPPGGLLWTVDDCGRHTSRTDASAPPEPPGRTAGIKAVISPERHARITGLYDLRVRANFSNTARLLTRQLPQGRGIELAKHTCLANCSRIELKA